jgi:hypothetical protein
VTQAQDAFAPDGSAQAAEPVSVGGPRELLAGWPLAVAVTGLLLLAAAVRLWLAGRIEAPWIEGDEFHYSEMAKSFASTGHFLLRDKPTTLFTLYPALISPAWLAGSMSTTYELAKTINVVLMTAAAIPLFFWARRLVSAPLAIVATVLFLVLPAFVYTGVLMTESAFLPAFMLTAFATALALERPTLPRQGLVLAAAAVATGIRFQGVILFGVVLTAIAFKVLLDTRAARASVWSRRTGELLRPFWPTFLAIALAAVAYLVYKEAQGQTIASGLRDYAGVLQNDYSFRAVLRWSAYHFGEVAFAVGIVPACAFIVVAALAVDGRFGFSAAVRAFVAFAAAAVLWFPIVAAMFASRFSLRIEERNMFYVEPLLLLALVVWLGAGCPRPRSATLVAVLVPAALAITLPLENFFSVAILGDTFGLVPLYRLSQLRGGPDEVRPLFALGVFAACLLFAFVPRRLAPILVPVAVAAFLVGATKSVEGAAHAQSVAARHSYGTGADASWVEHTLPKGKHAAFIYTAPLNGDPHVVWQTEFWNRDVGTVYDYGTTEPGFAGDPLTLDRRTGRLVPAGGGRVAEDYAVVDAHTTLAGRIVAQPGLMALYRIARPLRIPSESSGIYSDGWMESDAGWTQYAVPRGHRGRLRITLSRTALGPGAPPATATVRAGPVGLDAQGQPDIARTVVGRTVRLTPARSVTVTLPLLRAPFRAEVHVTPTFAASQLGTGDSRNLGAVVGFGVVP